MKTRDEISVFGINSRLDSLQAIVARHMLREVEAITQKRIANAALYDQGLMPLSPKVVVPPRRPNVRQVYHTYVIQAEDRSGLIEHLNHCGVEVKVHYPIPIHLQEAARPLGCKEGDFPVTERQSKRIVTLPVHQELGPKEIQFVVDSIRSFYYRPSRR
jgi:dTDP-4-amino-4,6-dideoxygalactose transaminase